MEKPINGLLTLRLEGLIPDGDSFRLLSCELEDLDYMLLYQAYFPKSKKCN